MSKIAKQDTEATAAVIGRPLRFRHGGMRVIGGFGAVLLLAQAAVFPALAASPNLSGVYTLHLTELCQAEMLIEQAGNGVDSNVGLLFPAGPEGQPTGMLTQTAGTMTFTPTTANGQSGSVSAVFTNVYGQGFQLSVNSGSPGPAMETNTTRQTGTYSMNSSSITIHFTGHASQTFNAYFGQLSIPFGTADHVDFVGIDSAMPTCSIAGGGQHE